MKDALKKFVEGGQAAQTAVDKVIAEKVPDAIRPRCPHCKADPLKIKRLRYDFPDGVVTEALFCANLECRALFSVAIVGFEAPKSRP